MSEADISLMLDKLIEKDLDEQRVADTEIYEGRETEEE